MKNKSNPSHLFSLILILLSACGKNAPTASPTITPATASLRPEITSLENSTSTPTNSPTSPSPVRPLYTLNVLLDYDRKYLSVEQTIAYPNQTGETLSDISLAVVPNSWQDVFSLFAMEQDGKPVIDYTLDSQRLLVVLPRPLQPGGTLNLVISYEITLPEIDINSDPNVIRPQIFGYTDRQINLVEWYPFIVPYVSGQGWLMHDPWFYGEHLVYDVADFDVNIKFGDPTIKPIIASSGPGASNGEWMHYSLQAGRTFALSVSKEFQVSSTTVNDVSIYSYYFPFEQKAGIAAMQASEQAVRVYTERYGTYPHTTLSVVQGDFNDGMEFSALFFLSRDFYNLYTQTPQDYLTIVAIHETAHQWWFEQVANDQALEPWLDEALSTYSEHIFYETVHPDLVDWWWYYRVDCYAPKGWIDIPVYDGGGFRPYTDAVYLRGAHFLEDLRRRIGDEAFFSFLRDYLSKEAGKIATSQDFFTILRQHTDTDYLDIIKMYFQYPR
ncbi:MAG: M1 family metallopeptidase [Anaerolineales bacterium]|nr:M1 family metallopeptidase [Anaerolineales bacterium]